MTASLKYFLLGLAIPLLSFGIVVIGLHQNIQYIPLWALLWSPMWLIYFLLTKNAFERFGIRSGSRVTYTGLGVLCGALGWIPSPLPPYLFSIQFLVLEISLHLLLLGLFVLLTFVIIRHLERIRARQRSSTSQKARD